MILCTTENDCIFGRTGGYEHTSTEVLANTMAYFYFGCPDSFKNNGNYPINTNWLSIGLIYKLYYQNKYNY